MATVSLEEMREYLAFTDDLGTADDDMIGRIVDAAEAHIDRLLGFKMGATYGGEGQPALPADLKQGVMMLAAHWYDNRDGTADARAQMPFGVASIVNEYREFTF